MKCKTVVCSSVGKKRKINQDNFYVNGLVNEDQKDELIKSYFASASEQVLCVCDGMGGEKFGEVASYLAVKKLAGYKERYNHLLDRFDEHVLAYVQSANNAICQLIAECNGERSGTTMALLCVSPEQKEAVAANVGDSKVFFFRKNELKKISEDHNRAQSLVNLGLITEAEAGTHKDKSKLTQHLGIFPDEMVLEPYVTDHIMLEIGDLFLICSDGLTDMLTVSEITDILGERSSLKERCKKLVESANEHGGVDNITVILAELV